MSPFSLKSADSSRPAFYAKQLTNRSISSLAIIAQLHAITFFPW